MAAADPKQRSANARIAADWSWAVTPDRSERTAAARAASPIHLAYWENLLRAEGRVREADIPAAAVNARRAWRAQNGKKSAEAKRRRMSAA